MAIDRRVTRTRTALFDALVALIRTKPYDSIAVEDILIRADVGRSTFYAHFASKDDLLERSLERLSAQLTHAMSEPHAGAVEADPWDPCRTLFEHVQDYKDVQLALTNGRGGIILREAIDAVLARDLRRMMSADAPQALPASLVIQHIIGTFHTVMRWWFAHRPEMSAADADVIFRRLVLTGLPDGSCGAFVRAAAHAPTSGTP